MLYYIFIEAALSNKSLYKLLKDNISDTFNSISVDGATSTNDTVMLFSVGGIELGNIKKNTRIFRFAGVWSDFHPQISSLGRRGAATEVHVPLIHYAILPGRLAG